MDLSDAGRLLSTPLKHGHRLPEKDILHKKLGVRAMAD